MNIIAAEKSIWKIYNQNTSPEKNPTSEALIQQLCNICWMNEKGKERMNNNRYNDLIMCLTI
jgi:hypothetical protein